MAVHLQEQRSTDGTLQVEPKVMDANMDAYGFTDLQ